MWPRVAALAAPSAYLLHDSSWIAARSRVDAGRFLPGCGHFPARGFLTGCLLLAGIVRLACLLSMHNKKAVPQTHPSTQSLDDSRLFAWVCVGAPTPPPPASHHISQKGRHFFEATAPLRHSDEAPPLAFPSPSGDKRESPLLTVGRNCALWRGKGRAPTTQSFYLILDVAVGGLVGRRATVWAACVGGMASMPWIWSSHAEVS